MIGVFYNVFAITIGALFSTVKTNYFSPLSPLYLLVLILSNNHADDNTYPVSMIDVCI
jgi:hypothetical protein